MVRQNKETNRVAEMLDDLLADCQTPEDILGESGLLKQLSKRLIERALVGELNYHLKAEQESELDEPDSESLSRGNSRNGYSKKTIQSNHGEIDLAIPRDRKGDFEPVLVPKHQRHLAGLNEKILVLYGRGLSTRDISAQLMHGNVWEWCQDTSNENYEGTSIDGFLIILCLPSGSC